MFQRSAISSLKSPWIAGTDPEKYQRGWLAQKLSSCKCHNNVQFIMHKMVQDCYNKWDGHAGGPDRPSFRK